MRRNEVRPDVKRAAKLLAKTEAQQDQKSAKKAKVLVEDLLKMRLGFQSFFLPSPPQPQTQPGVLEVEEELQLDWAEGWFSSAQLGFPLLEDNFDRHLHLLITQYISAKQHTTPF